MKLVLLTALGVGSATVFGSLLGFIFKKISHKFSDIIMAFAAGVMLAAAVIGLILPSLEYGGKYGIIITVVGIFLGALCINLIDKLVPHLHKVIGPQENEGHNDKKLDKVLLFVMAIAIHNLPEGMAAGVGFWTGDLSDAFFIALGIAIQNLPEGMVLIAPMLSAGISPKRTFFYAFLTGVIEIIGTFIGYFAVGFASVLLPFVLAFAGGTMIYVISEDMMRDEISGKSSHASYSLLIGFSLMLIFNFVLS